MASQSNDLIFMIHEMNLQTGSKKSLFMPPSGSWFILWVGSRSRAERHISKMHLLRFLPSGAPRDQPLNWDPSKAADLSFLPPGWPMCKTDRPTNSSGIWPPPCGWVKHPASIHPHQTHLQQAMHNMALWSPLSMLFQNIQWDLKHLHSQMFGPELE